MFSQFQPNKGSKKAKKSGSNIFSLFSQKQIQEFKEAFGIIDNDKDGIITAPDLKKAFAQMPDCLHSAGMAQMPDTYFFLDLVNVGGFNSL